MTKTEAPKLKTLAPAEAAVANYDKIQSAIEAEVDKLQPLILERLEAEQALSTAAVATALKERADVPKARTRLEASQKALDDSSNLLRGLRSKLAGLGSELAARREALAGELPEYNRELAQGFEGEWQAAVSAFEQALSKRRSLEGLLGQEMTLPEPAAGAASMDVAEAGRPHRVLTSLGEALSRLTTMRRAAGHLATAPMMFAGSKLLVYDPTQCYKLTHPVKGLPAGTLVCDATFDPGRLKSALEADWAKPVRAADVDPNRGLRDAELATKKIAADVKAEEDRKRKALEAEMRRKQYEEAERRDPSLRHQDLEPSPPPARVTITPAVMFPDNPERRQGYVQAAHMHPGPNPISKMLGDLDELEKL